MDRGHSESLMQVFRQLKSKIRAEKGGSFTLLERTIDDCQSIHQSSECYLFDSVQQPLQEVLPLGITLLSACNKTNKPKLRFNKQKNHCDPHSIPHISSCSCTCLRKEERRRTWFQFNCFCLYYGIKALCFSRKREVLTFRSQHQFSSEYWCTHSQAVLRKEEFPASSFTCGKQMR